MASSLPSPEIALTSSNDGQIIAFHSSSGSIIATFSGSFSPRKGLALVGNTQIAAAHISPETGASAIHIYSWYSRSPFCHVPLPEPVAPLIATPDGDFIFSGGISGMVYALSVPSGKIVGSYQSFRKPISCLEISFDRSLLLVGGDDGAIVVLSIFKIVDFSSKEGDIAALHRLVGHCSPVTAIASGGTSGTAISCSVDGTCVLWSLLQGIRLWTIGFPCALYVIAMDAGETGFYTAGSDGWVYEIEAVGASREPVRWSERQGGTVVGMDVDGNGRLVTASDEGRVWVWAVAEKRVIRVVGEGFGGVSHLVVARDLGGGGAWRNVRCCLGDERIWEDEIGDFAAEEMLREATRERSKAIDVLESAIGMYEKLLELILKEIKEGI